MLASALLEKLHAFFPDAAIDLVVRKGNDGLYTGHPFLRKLYVWDKRRGKTRDLFRLVRAFRKERYDHVINAQRFFSTGLMTVLSGGKETIGYDKNPLSFRFTRKVKHDMPDWKALRGKDPNAGAPFTHEVDRLNDLIEHLTDGERPMPRLYPTAEAREKVRTILATAPTQGPGAETLRKHGGASTGDPAATRYVTIAPASVWFTKQWRKDKWIALVQTLPREFRMLLIGGPGDMPLCEEIVQEAGRGEVLAGKLSLLETAALMEGAANNFVNDSGPLHIASAMRAPTTAVFCSTVPAFGFGPLAPESQVVQYQGPLYCRPCGLHGRKRCPEGHFKCSGE